MKKILLIGLAFGLTACGDLPVPSEGLMTPPSVEKALKDTLEAGKGMTDDAMKMADKTGEKMMDAGKGMKDDAMKMADKTGEKMMDAGKGMKDDAMDMQDKAADLLK